jgi:HD-GYP domain-containing protein (c-di-GMP phosphodiesterase class II)
MSDKVSAFISYIMIAVSNCALYSKDHPAVKQFSEKAIKIMDELYEDNELSIIMLGDSLHMNEVRITDKDIHITNFIKRLRRKGIEKIIFKKGVKTEELTSLIVDLASTDKALTSYPHISVGIVEVKMKVQDGIDVSKIVDENTSRIKEVYRGLSRFERLDIVGLEDIVIDFISTLKREANVLRVISPVKSYSEYTYTHTTNVTILSIFQAESLGLKGDILHDVGLAGLLHDVGKMFISKDILEKDAKLTPNEWEEMKKHPTYGALYLSKLPDMPKLAVIAAFEHHMKFNGSGYPETKRRGMKQHIISQIVAISDFFDALRTERPYRKALDVPVILGLLRESSGKDFNPMLVDNFLFALKRIKAI